MKCDDAAEAILSGSALSGKIKEHAATCAECGKLRDMVLELEKAGERERARDLSRAAVQSIISQATRITKERVSPPHLRMKEWWLVQRLAAAAAILFAVGAAGILSGRILKRHSEAEKPVAVLAIDSLRGMDSLRYEVKRDVAGFERRYEREPASGGLSTEFDSLRSRIAMASSSVEYELAGL